MANTPVRKPWKRRRRQCGQRGQHGTDARCMSLDDGGRLPQADFIRLVGQLTTMPGRIGDAFRAAAEGVGWRLSHAAQADEWHNTPFLARLGVLVDAAQAIAGRPAGGVAAVGGTTTLRMGDANPWVPYNGPRGGKGWRHGGTGRVIYQTDRPGANEMGDMDTTSETQKTPDKIRELVALVLAGKISGKQAKKQLNKDDQLALHWAIKEARGETRPPQLQKSITQPSTAALPEESDDDKEDIEATDRAIVTSAIAGDWLPAVAAYRGQETGEDYSELARNSPTFSDKEIAEQIVKEFGSTDFGLDSDDSDEQLSAVVGHVLSAMRDLAEAWADQEQERRSNEEMDRRIAVSHRIASVADAIEKAVPGVTMRESGGGSWYGRYRHSDIDIKLRVADHPQKEGGGFNEQLQERMGESDIQWVITSPDGAMPTPDQIRAAIVNKIKTYRRVEDYGSPSTIRMSGDSQDYVAGYDD